jgi:hypothetical protein
MGDGGEGGEGKGKGKRERERAGNPQNLYAAYDHALMLTSLAHVAEAASNDVATHAKYAQ